MCNLFTRNSFLLAILCVFASLNLNAQSDDLAAKQGVFDLLTLNDVAEITIEVDLDSLLGDIRRTEYLKGSMEIKTGKKEYVSIPLKVRPRGKFRRMKCNFPPLKLKFKKDDLAEKGLNEYNEFKLVTQCLKDDEMAKEMIMKEFLAYKMLNELTPYSFRVQLVRVTYKHTGKSKKIKHWGIIIEDLEDLAHRTNTTVVSRMGIPLDSLHNNQEKLASLFQYMIGNCDWSYFLARNMEFIQLTDGRIMPVPYDFDYCGLVNAPYSAPNVQLGQKSVKDRIYLGNSTSYEEIYGTLSYFRTREKDLMNILKNCKELNSIASREIEKYLNEFFILIKDEKKAADIILSKPASSH